MPVSESAATNESTEPSVNTNGCTNSEREMLIVRESVDIDGAGGADVGGDGVPPDSRDRAAVQSGLVELMVLDDTVCIFLLL
eukprot:CAMPEP_0116838640 /NCGR_PEP_ID=MMETSP0418-20121206/9326_1 /TAXON_ID=1158023 /ORGANISM="Astrosyne radiata, Strain 13vi08-1A" /LENGTH=81 /DNA_ID=CAMNT_0004468667 /DNA_START=330 /DNA_END=575 /DNA_ORIENTATION=-